jgi:hypothetical protein
MKKSGEWRLMSGCHSSQKKKRISLEKKGKNLHFNVCTWRLSVCSLCPLYIISSLQQTYERKGLDDTFYCFVCFFDSPFTSSKVTDSLNYVSLWYMIFFEKLKVTHLVKKHPTFTDIRTMFVHQRLLCWAGSVQKLFPLSPSMKRHLVAASSLCWICNRG